MEGFHLVWESAQLTRLGSFIQDMVSSKVSRLVTSFWLQRVVASTIVLPLMVVNAINDLDNAWSTVKEKVRLAGEALAQALMDNHAVGRRPITLIGYSMGAKVIYKCLQKLFAANVFHCVQDVVLLGAPISASKSKAKNLLKWTKARAVVSGRFLNGYSTSDWMLGFLYRYMEWGVSVAGLHPVNIPGVEDVDITALVRTHADYPANLQNILTYVYNCK